MSRPRSSRSLLARPHQLALSLDLSRPPWPRSCPRCAPTRLASPAPQLAPSPRPRARPPSPQQKLPRPHPRPRRPSPRRPMPRPPTRARSTPPPPPRSRRARARPRRATARGSPARASASARPSRAGQTGSQTRCVGLSLSAWSVSLCGLRRAQASGRRGGTCRSRSAPPLLCSREPARQSCARARHAQSTRPPSEPLTDSLPLSPRARSPSP